jgi:hypothetical protein
MVGAETTGTPLSFAVSALISLIALALVLWQARRQKLDRWFRPAAQPAAPAGSAAPGVALPPSAAQVP